MTGRFLILAAWCPARAGTRRRARSAFYKEWQLSGPATAIGVLRPLVDVGDPKVTLIVHGRGRTEASEFTDWTLMIDGPAGRLTLYGALTSAAR
jgi:hypothetical protein